MSLTDLPSNLCSFLLSDFLAWAYGPEAGQSQPSEAGPGLSHELARSGLWPWLRIWKAVPIGLWPWLWVGPRQAQAPSHKQRACSATVVASHDYHI
jgi:hypothetical protein